MLLCKSISNEPYRLLSEFYIYSSLVEQLNQTESNLAHMVLRKRRFSYVQMILIILGEGPKREGLNKSLKMSFSRNSSKNGNYDELKKICEIQILL